MFLYRYVNKPHILTAEWGGGDLFWEDVGSIIMILLWEFPLEVKGVPILELSSL